MKQQHQEVGLSEIAQQRDQLKQHFKEEFKVKNAMNNHEKELENQNWSLLNKRAECNLVIKEKGASNIQVKIINEEIDEVSQKIGAIKTKLAEEESRFDKLLAERDNI